MYTLLCLFRPVPSALFLCGVEWNALSVICTQLMNTHCQFHCSFSEQEEGTPLFVASQNGHSATVDVLLRCGADPNIARNVSQFSNFTSGIYE